MSSSAARLAANAANAQHSTGPRTPEGQARSSQNARTHGLTARDLIVAENEREEFDEFLSSYQADVKPNGAIQQTLFDELLGAAWNLRRVRRMEAALCRTTSYDDLAQNEELQKKLDRLARHKCRIERTFHRSLKELKALQASTVRQTVIAKQTQQFEQRAKLRRLEAIIDAPAPVAKSAAHVAQAYLPVSDLDR